MRHKLQPGEPEEEGHRNDAAYFTLKAEVATDPKEKAELEAKAAESLAKAEELERRKRGK